MKNVLLLVDVTEDYLKPRGPLYIGNKESERVITHLSDQLQMARRTNTPVIYAIPEVNRENKVGTVISDLAPRNDVLISKPSLSAFIDTPLETILRRTGANNIIVGGVCTHTSILFTLYDALIRGFEVTVFEDCIASSERMYHTFGLKIMRDSLKIEII